MTREEFENAVKKVSKNDNYFREHALSDKYYREIEYVYTWYPNISSTNGKEQIAWLYVNLGIGIIRDMYERASNAQDIDEEIRSKTQELNELKDKYGRLVQGWEK